MRITTTVTGRRTEQAKANLDPRVCPRVCPRERPRQDTRGLMFSAVQWLRRKLPRNVPRRRPRKCPRKCAVKWSSFTCSVFTCSVRRPVTFGSIRVSVQFHYYQFNSTEGWITNCSTFTFACFIPQESKLHRLWQHGVCKPLSPSPPKRVSHESFLWKVTQVHTCTYITFQRAQPCVRLVS